MDDGDDHRSRLAAEWSRNEAQIQRLHDSPDLAGPTDPATRERELLRRQDEIEHELAKLDFDRRRAEGTEQP